MIVQAGNRYHKGKIILWEVNEDHPGGTIFITEGSGDHDVGLTPLVERRIRTGDLIIIENDKSPDPDPAPLGEIELAQVPAALAAAPPQVPEIAPPAPFLGDMVEIKGLGETSKDKLLAAGIEDVYMLATMSDDQMIEIFEVTGLSITKKLAPWRKDALELIGS
jgi:hypothetical protein